MSVNVQELTNSVLNDNELMARLEKAENSQEVSELLAEKGVVISADKIDEFMENQLGSGELSEDQLQNVAGGFKLSYLNPLYWVGRLIAYCTSKDLC